MMRILITLLSAGLAVAMVVLLVMERSKDWMKYQERFFAMERNRTGQGREGEGGGEQRSPEVVEISLRAWGARDRCPTCHLGLTLKQSPYREHPFRPHPPGVLEDHPVERFGCTACHGGQGRSLDMASAHDRQPGGGPDPFLLQPFIQGNCARCHIASGLPGCERYTDGIWQFLDLGCVACHRAWGAERAIGSDLNDIGRRGIDFIRKAVLDPGELFPGSYMPEYRRRLEGKEPALQALLVYLLSLRGGWGGTDVPLVSERSRFDQPCEVCHLRAGQGDLPAGRAHRCTYIKRNREVLRCRRCHQGLVSPQGTERSRAACPVVKRHRPFCRACHR